MMLLVPLGILAIGRALIPALDRLETITASSDTPSAAPPSSAAAEAPGLHVKVTDSEGRPMDGAGVHLVSPSAPYEQADEARTDPTGSATFPHPHLDRLRVIAVHYPQGVVTSDEIVLKEDETTEVELIVSSADAIVGKVVDTSDHPVGGATLAVDGMPWALAPTTVTESDGTFRLTTVPHEAGALVAVARGFRTGRATLVTRRARTELAESVVRIELVPAPPVEGDVLDVDGNGVRARVVACEHDPSESETSSGADGKFALPASATGCAIVAIDDAYGASDAVTAVEGHRLTLRLKPGGAIEGVVVDERGSAIPSFTLGIESFTGERGKSGRSSGQRPFEDRGGSFRWDKLGPGTYVLTASAPGKPPTRSDPVEVKSGATTPGVRITVASGGVVQGHVYDEKHAPVAGVTLSFDQVSSVVASTAFAKTDDSGAYTLEGAPAGPFTLRAEKRGFRMQMIAGLVAPAGKTLAQDVTLTPADGNARMEFGGIGATLQQTRDGVAFASVFPGDPADQAGLRAGDVVVSVDGEPTDSMSVADVLQRLRGEAGTPVSVSVQRVGAGGPSEPREKYDTVVMRATVVR